jgi:MGT family glycosyltransferase
LVANQPSIVFFCTPEAGHFQAIRPLIARIAARGMAAYVFTHRDFEAATARCGGRFVNLFDKYPIDEADRSSNPIPCRYVSFAGHYANEVIADVRAIDPSLIIYETFSVIGPVAAQALDIPYVNVCVNHNPNPARCLKALAQDKRVAVSDQCLRAVERLRTEFCQEAASPFSYVSSLSPYLNVYCEPPQFLPDEDRSAFEPLAFFGCLLDPPATNALAEAAGGYFQNVPDALRVYVSFGTVIWRYFAEEARGALQAISQTCAEMEHVRACISLGGAVGLEHLLSSLANDHVQIHRFVDQISMLQQADVFVTHHGLNSTHEAIFQGVPMLSYPFFSDQPALARKCHELGLALPLCNTPREPLTAGDVKAALTKARQQTSTLKENLARAYDWEMETIRAREVTLERLDGLITSRSARGAPQ